MKAASGYRFRLRTFHVAEPILGTGPRLTQAAEVAVKVRAIIEGDSLDMNREHFFVLALNARGDVNGYKVISSGTLSATVVHPREVFRTAIALDAVHLIIAHNHPSGDADPSPEDMTITETLQEAGALMGIPVIDHVIVAKAASGWTFRSIGGGPVKPRKCG